MIFTCDKCHFIFSRAVEPEQCPDCGKYAVRSANEAEQQEYEEHLKEFSKPISRTGVENNAKNPIGH